MQRLRGCNPLIMAKKKPVKKAPKKSPKKQVTSRVIPTPPPITPNPIPPPLNPNPDNPSRIQLSYDEQAFVTEYLQCFRAGQAYRRVHPYVTRESAKVLGYRTLAKVHVKNEIEAEMSERRNRSRVRSNKIIKSAYQLLMADIADCYDAHNNLLPVQQIPVETRRWIQSFEDSDREIDTGKSVIRERTRKCRILNKATAFTILAKHLGLDDKIPSIEIVLNMLPKEAAQILREMLRESPVKETVQLEAVKPVMHPIKAQQTETPK